MSEFNLDGFLEELSALSDKYDLVIGGCGCCSSPWIKHKEAAGKYTADVCETALARGDFWADALTWEKV